MGSSELRQEVRVGTDTVSINGHRLGLHWPDNFSQVTRANLAANCVICARMYTPAGEFVLDVGYRKTVTPVDTITEQAPW